MTSSFLHSPEDAAFSLQERSAPTLPTRYILKHLLIIPGDAAPIHDGAIAIAGNNILAVGTTDTILKKYTDLPILDARHYIAIPGLINSHTHAAMGFFRGLGHGVSQMIEKLFFPAESSLTPELIEPLAYSYILSGLRSGVTCFIDHYYFVAGVGHALKRLGLRGVLGETTADLGSAFPSLKTWNRAQDLINQWPFDSDCIRPCLAPHAADTVSFKLMQKIAQVAKSESLPVHMHLSQTSGERERVLKREGLTPVRVAAKAGLLGAQTLAVHLISADAEDLRILADCGITAGLCPASQIIYESLAPIKLFAQLRIPTALGTDCAASNDNADIMSELKLICLLAKEHQLPKTQQTVEHWLESVTVNPARCFGFDRLIGSLSPGKRADIVLLKRDVTTEPMFKPVNNLIFSLGSSHVRHVMVDGKWVLWQQNPCLVAEADIRAAYLDSVAEMERRLKDKHNLVLSD